MTGTQKQLGNKVQISGRIRNFKKVATKTKRPMAVFTIGAEDAKCFDFIVSEAETYAVSQEWVRLSGRRSNHDGHVEFVADKIVPASLNKDSRSVDCREVFAEPPNQKQIPIRESSNIVENLCGVVGDLRTVPTQSGRLMVTFMVGSVRCKAFGDFAAAVQNANGKQIEVSARKGSFQGITEYAVRSE